MIGINRELKTRDIFPNFFFVHEAAIESSKFDRTRKKIVAAAECEENQAL